MTVRYATNTSQRSRVEPVDLPARSPHQIATTDSASDAAYTSVSVALNMTDDMLPAQMAPANAAQRSPVARASHHAPAPPASAEASAEKELVASGVGRNQSSSDQLRVRSTNSGVPGGCGIPSE